ncbi:hypothetical protein SLS55_009972 [Diplodia seriata]|uniref:Uncharacterized protein n=1 Tax=Diplodia seriata TaxID=420778 RepID=A0ABR3C438_9PEZI
MSEILTEPKLPVAMPDGNEQSVETLFENFKNEWEYEKEGNPGVFDATTAPKAKTAKDRELDADLKAMNLMPAKAYKKVQKKQPKTKKTPKAPSTTIPPAIQAPSNRVPTRKSPRLQKQSIKPTTTKSAASGTLSKTTIPDSDDDSDSSSTSSLTSLSSSAISALRPTPPPSPTGHQPAATATGLPPYPPIRGPPIAYPTTHTRGARGTLADGRTFHPRPSSDRAIHPPPPPALADIQTDILDRALLRHPRWPTTNARGKPDAVQYANIAGLVASIKDAVVRGDAFEERVREETAWRDPETGADERSGRHVEEDVVEAWGERWGEAAERFFGRKGDKAKRREGYSERARKGWETKRRNAEEAERKKNEKLEKEKLEKEKLEKETLEKEKREKEKREKDKREKEKREKEKREKEKREKEKREKLKKEKFEKVEATASKGKRTHAEEMTSADKPKRGFGKGSQSTVADKPKHAMRPRTKSAVKAMEARMTRATEFMFDAGMKNEDAILNDDAKEEHDKSKIKDRQPTGVQTKRKREDISPGPLPQTPIKTHAQAATRSATKPTPAMSAVSISDEDTVDEETVDEDAVDEDSSYEGDTKVAIPSARLKITCGPARPRANVTTRVHARTSPAPSKRKVSFSHISDGERAGVKKTRVSPRKLRSSTPPTMPASQSKRRRTRDMSSSSDEVTPPPSQRRRLVSMKELKALRQMRESSSSSEEGAPSPQPRRRLVSMKDLRLQDAAKSTSDNSFQAEHSVEQPKGLPAASSGDHNSQPSPITDLELNDSANSAHKTDPLVETAPATQVLQSQAEPSNPAPCPSTSRSEAPAYHNRPDAHDAADWRSRSPVTGEEHARQVAAREILVRTIEKLSSTDASGSRTAAVTNDSSSVRLHQSAYITIEEDAYKVTEGHSGEHGATTTAPSPAGLTTPSPSEPRGSAVATRSGVDTASGAAVKDSGFTSKPEPSTGDSSGEQSNSAAINYAEGAADSKASNIIVQHAEGATINEPSDTVNNSESPASSRPSDTIDNAADAGYADGFGNSLSGEQTGSDEPDNSIIKAGVEYASQQCVIDTFVVRVVDPATAGELQHPTSTVDAHDRNTGIGHRQAVVGESANPNNSADATPDRAEDSGAAGIDLATE